MNLCMIGNLGWFLGVSGFGICIAKCVCLCSMRWCIYVVWFGLKSLLVSVIIVNRREDLRWEREEWIMLNGVRDKIVF